MNVKIAKRVAYGVAAALFLLVGGKELLAAGLTPQSGLAGGAGLILLFSAATGKG